MNSLSEMFWRTKIFKFLADLYSHIGEDVHNALFCRICITYYKIIEALVLYM